MCANIAFLVRKSTVNKYNEIWLANGSTTKPGKRKIQPSSQFSEFEFQKRERKRESQQAKE